MAKIAQCELCSEWIDYKKEPIHVCEYVECASCQQKLRFNSEDLNNTTCARCGGEAK